MNGFSPKNHPLEIRKTHHTQISLTLGSKISIVQGVFFFLSYQQPHPLLASTWNPGKTPRESFTILRGGIVYSVPFLGASWPMLGSLRLSTQGSKKNAKKCHGKVRLFWRKLRKSRGSFTAGFFIGWIFFKIDVNMFFFLKMILDVFVLWYSYWYVYIYIQLIFLASNFLNVFVTLTTFS